MFLPSILAVFTPEVITVESIIDYAALATTMLTILATAFALVAGVVLALGVGRRVVGWFRGAR